MLPNASILHGRIDNALFCRTLSFGLARISLCFLGEKKNENTKKWVILDASFVKL